MKKILTICLMMVAMMAAAQEKIILLNEGNWQADNAKVTYFEDGKIVSNQWFRDVNGYKIGDTPNDIIQVSNDLLAIAVNWSNIIQFITPQGKAVAAIEDVPNNRRLATDGRYVYVTSYAHECGAETFDKGYVAKIDTQTFTVVGTCEVGYEPEGIALYGGHLFVCNSGGYSFEEDHEYERTVSIVDPVTMQLVRDIDTGCPNLYGDVSQSGRYLLISSAGDYYEATPCAVILDCERALKGEACVKVLDTVVTFNTVDRDGRFLTVGSAFSYLTGGYEMSCSTIDPEAAFNGTGGITETLPGTVMTDIMDFAMPYSIYVNPYTGYIYATDAATNASAGKMYQWTPDGTLVDSYKVYINPGHFLALPPDGIFDGITDVETTASGTHDALYDLTGRKVTTPTAGHVYIRDGRKYISQKSKVKS